VGGVKMVNKLNQKEKKQLLWIIGITLAINFLAPDVTTQLDSFSILGGVTGFGISFGVLLMLIGFVLILIPTPVTTLPGVGLLIGGLIMGYGSFMSLLNDMFGGFSTIASVGIFVVIGWMLLKKIF